MSKRKILLLAVAVALAAVLAAGGTLAYFTDTDAAKNVLTAGSVSIVQNETDRSGKDFENAQALFPVTGEDTEETSWGVLRASGQNYIDKIITVTNDGRGGTYIRTLFAFQLLEGGADPFDLLYIAHTEGMEGKGIEWIDTPVELDGRTYRAGVFYYKNGSHLAPGETTEPSLLQIGLDGDATNAEAELFVDYNILVVTQASQTPGFSDARTALDAAFGAFETADAAQLQEWFSAAK